MLTPKEELFVDNYLRTFNKTKAAEGLYPETLTRNQLCIRGAKLFKKPRIQRAIALRLQERVASTDELLDRWSEQVRSEYHSYIRVDGTVDIEQLIADGKSHLIKRIRPTRFGLDVEFYDAQKAQEMLARYYGLFDDSIRVKEGVQVFVKYADEVVEGELVPPSTTPLLTAPDDDSTDDSADDFEDEELDDQEDFDGFDEFEDDE